MFRDNFTDFTFNGVPSSKMKVWIINNHDLKESITPNLKDTYVAPSFMDGRYYGGTSIENSTIKVNCIAINITAQEKRAITKWLSPYALGRLSFGDDPFYYYDVKINSGIEANKWVKSRYDSVCGGYLYIYEFSIEFATTNTWMKQSLPVTFDLNYLRNSHKISTTDNSGREYLFYRNYNDYNLGFLSSSKQVVLPAGLYTWQELKTKLNYKHGWHNTYFYFLRKNKTNSGSKSVLPFLLITEQYGRYAVAVNEGMTDCYPSIADDWLLPNSEYFEILYPCIIDAPNVSEKDYNKGNVCYNESTFNICNPGSLPMTYHYFLSGKSGVSTNTSDNSAVLLTDCIILDDDIQYSFGLSNPYPNYYYNYNLDSDNGIIMNNGDFCQNVSFQGTNLNLANSYFNNGHSTIKPGNPEIVELNNQQIPVFSYFKSVQPNQENDNKFGSLTENIVSLTKTNFQHDFSLQTYEDEAGAIHYYKYYTVGLSVKDLNVHFSVKGCRVGDTVYHISVGGTPVNELKFYCNDSVLNTYPDEIFLPVLPHTKADDGADNQLNKNIIKDSKASFGSVVNMTIIVTAASATEEEMKIEESVSPQITIKLEEDLLPLKLHPYNSSSESWGVWYYAYFDLPCDTQNIHNNLIMLSFFNNKNHATSLYSVDPDSIPISYDKNMKEIINIPAYAIPYLDDAGKHYLRCICSPIDVVNNFPNIEDYTQKVVEKTSGTLISRDEIGKIWAPSALYELTDSILDKYMYVAIGDAQRLDVVLDTQNGAEILFETLSFSTKEV